MNNMLLRVWTTLSILLLGVTGLRAEVESVGSRGPLYSLQHSGDAEDGRQKYTQMLSMSKMPHYGECWKQAVEQLHLDCDALTDDVQSHLALMFANCFLEMAGQSTYPCPWTSLVSQCVLSMDDKAFGTYTAFFTHTQNMCFFIKTQLWHEAAESTIDQLLHTSSKVHASMEDHLEVQKELLENDRRLLDHREQLVRSIEASKDGVQELMNDFQKSTGEQQLFVNQLIHRVVKFHSMVVSEFAGVYSLVFLFVVLILSYLLTATTRTANARFWLFCIAVANFGVEKVAISWRLDENVLMNSDNVQTMIYERVWFIRKLSCFLAFLVLCVSSFLYHDVNIASYELLKAISHQNLKIMSTLTALGNESFRTNSSSSEPVSSKITTSDAEVQSDWEDELTDSSEIASNGHVKTIKKISRLHKVFRAAVHSIMDSPVEQTNSVRGVVYERNDDSVVTSQQATPRLMPYNLRNRSKPCSPNPVVKVEHPQSFAATVHRLADISKRNSEQLRKALKRKAQMCHGVQFSSDDE